MTSRTGSTGRRLTAEVAGSAAWMLGLLGLLWGIELVNLLSGNQLIRFGILPRTLVGLRGIAFAPLLHGSLAHLIANTVPLLVLGSLVLTRGRGVFLSATLAIALVGGTLTWLLGRPAYHVGASGVIFGYLGFLVGTAWRERHPLSILLALIGAGLYGGILLGALPLIPGVSWEGHLFGFVAGLGVGLSGVAADRPARRPSEYV